MTHSEDLIYIEFISRNPGIGLTDFRFMIKSLQEGWQGAHSSDDELLFNMNRTWRVGPEPELLTIWRSPNGLTRLDEWESLYRDQDEEGPWNIPFRLAGRMDAAGCYTPLIPPKPGRGGRYYAEFFNHAPNATPEAVRDFYLERAAKAQPVELLLLVDRIGFLGPDPRSIAVWATPSWTALTPTANEFGLAEHTIVSVAGGLYADLGDEVR